MLVTINTDASFNSDYKVGAYAFWIVCNEGKIMRSGVLKEAKNPTDAELRCIANALHCVLNSEIKGISKIIINSDALHAFGKVIKASTAGSPERKCYDILKKLKQKHLKDLANPIHEFRHVKAHSGVGEKRKWVNDWCDRAAKLMMRHEVQKIKVKKNINQ